MIQPSLAHTIIKNPITEPQRVIFFSSLLMTLHPLFPSTDPYTKPFKFC